MTNPQEQKQIVQTMIDGINNFFQLSFCDWSGAQAYLHRCPEDVLKLLEHHFSSVENVVVDKDTFPTFKVLRLHYHGNSEYVTTMSIFSNE